MNYVTQAQFHQALAVFTRVLLELERTGGLRPEVYMWIEPSGYYHPATTIVARRVDLAKGPRGEVAALRTAVRSDLEPLALEQVMHRTMRTMARKVYEAAVFNPPIEAEEGSDDAGDGSDA